MEAQNQNVVTALCENARFLYNNNIFSEALVDAELAYKLGETNMLDLIVKCNQILTESLPVAVPVFKILECHATMDVESIHIDIFKPILPPPPPKDDPLVTKVLESQQLFAMLEIPFPKSAPKESHMGKLVRKMMLKIHPDKCSDLRASTACAKLSASYKEYIDNPQVYIFKYAASAPKPAPSKPETYTKPDMSKFHKYYSNRGQSYAEEAQPKTKPNPYKTEDAPRRKFRAANEDPTEESRPVPGRNSKGRRTFGGK
jgi:hypothetical protein